MSLKKRLDKLEKATRPQAPPPRRGDDEGHTRSMVTLCAALETVTGELIEVDELSTILEGLNNEQPKKAD